ncbi:MAG: M16 family metallopeptidase [Polyangiales bacterium]
MIAALHSLALGLRILAALPNAAPQPLFPLTVDTLDNGLTIVTAKTGATGTIAYFTLVKAGSRDEVEAGKSGYAHLFEHLMFRGTKTVPAADYEKKMQALGADANAFTTDDFTLYVPVIPKESLSELVSLEADRFQHLDVAEHAYKDETGAVMGEYNKSFQNPYQSIDEAMREVAFTKHTYGHTTLGYKRDVEAMPKSYAYSKSFFSRFYTPDGVVIFAVGDVDRAKVVDLVRTNYGGWQGKRAVTQATPEPPQTAPRTKALTWKSPTLPRIEVAYKVPPASQIEDAAALAVLARLVFGDSSDLYQRLVVKEQKLISLGSDPDEVLHKDAGLFRVDAKIKPGAATFDEIGELIQTAIDGVAAGHAKPAEVAACRSHITNELLLEMQTPSAIAQRLAYLLAATGDVHGLDRYLAAIAKVTPEDLARVAKAHLIAAHRTTVTLAPPADGKPKKGGK